MAMKAWWKKSAEHSDSGHRPLFNLVRREEDRSHSILSISHLWVFDLKHLSLSQDAQVGRFCHHPAVFVPGDSGRRNSVGLTLQSYWFPDQHIHHHRRVPTAVPDTWRNLKAEEMGKYLSWSKSWEHCVRTVWMWTHWKLWGECACRPLLLRSWPHSCTFPHQILLLSESGVCDHLKTDEHSWSPGHFI